MELGHCGRSEVGAKFTVVDAIDAIDAVDLIQSDPLYPTMLFHGSQGVNR